MEGRRDATAETEYNTKRRHVLSFAVCYNLKLLCEISYTRCRNLILSYRPTNVKVTAWKYKKKRKNFSSLNLYIFILHLEKFKDVNKRFSIKN